MNKKTQKRILFQFNHLTNEKLLEILKIKIPKYFVLIESEKIAKEILSKYGIITNDLYYKEKHNVLNLMEFAKIRNLNIPSEYYNFELNEFDIMARIKDFEYSETRWIDNHSYLLDACHNGEISNDFTLKSDESAIKVSRKFDEIIIKEFGEDKFKMFQSKLKFLDTTSISDINQKMLVR